MLVDGMHRFQFLGLVLDGEEAILRHASRRCRIFWLVLMQAFCLRRLSGPGHRVLVGHFCHHFGVRPSTLSVSQESFAFIQDNPDRVAVFSAAHA